MKRADSLLTPFIKSLGIEDAVRLGRIKQEWPSLFEKPVSLHMSPAVLREKELVINVDSPVWLQQLSFYKENIVQKLNGFGINSVRFKLGKIFPEKKDEAITKNHVLTPGDHSYIEDIVASIGDPALKEKIRKAVEKSLAFKKRS